MATATDFDALALLMENTGKGFLSIIEYDKGDGLPVKPRQIEPRKLVEGSDDLLVRSMQFMPEIGVRMFRVSRILTVKCCESKIAGANSFCSAEILPKAAVFSRPKKRRALEHSERESAMSITISAVMPGESKSTTFGQPSDWFIQYAQAVRDATLDLTVTSEEAAAVKALAGRLDLSKQQMKAVHAYIMAETMFAASMDGKVTSEDVDHIEALNACLDQLGWRPVKSDTYH